MEESRWPDQTCMEEGAAERESVGGKTIRSRCDSDAINVAPALSWKLTGVPAPLSAVEWAVVSEAFGNSIRAAPRPPTPPPQLVAKVVVPLEKAYHQSQPGKPGKLFHNEADSVANP